MTSAAPPDKPAKYALLPSGHTIAGRYRITRVKGEGAQGVVYEALRVPEEKHVALKVLHRHLCGSDQIFKRFHREARILKRLDGEHLVKLLDFIEDDGLVILALDYVDGTSLEARLKERCPLEIKEAIEITLQICAALGAAHAAGIVHRDLKPANVLLEHPEPEPVSTPGLLVQDGPPPAPLPAPGSIERWQSQSPFAKAEHLRVRVVDFGLAKVLAGDPMTTSLTEHGMIFGTPEYMAPEQARGDEADARSDLYAAGVILYEMTVGRAPFHGLGPLATMTAHQTETPPAPRAARPGGEISAALEAVILRALAKAPADRYPDARTFAEALAATRHQQRVIAIPAAPFDPDLAATGDTDLHLSMPAIGTAKTLPGPALAALRRYDLDQAESQKPMAPRATTDADTGPTKRPYAPAQRTEPRSGAAVQDPANIPHGRNLWFWAVIAIVAALIGVALGALMGTR
jgi:serine/threonine-protein kinase